MQLVTENFPKINILGYTFKDHMNKTIAEMFVPFSLLSVSLGIRIIVNMSK